MNAYQMPSRQGIYPHDFRLWDLRSYDLWDNILFGVQMVYNLLMIV